MSTPNRHFKPNAVYADPNRHEPTTMDAIRHELGSRFEERKGEFWLDGRRTDFFTLAKAAGINLRNRR